MCLAAGPALHALPEIRTARVFALFRLRRFRAAATEIGAVGDFDSPLLSFERHPQTYPGRKGNRDALCGLLGTRGSEMRRGHSVGSMVPWTLRVLHAELPHQMGDTHSTLDRLYALLDLCQRSMVRCVAGKGNPHSLTISVVQAEAASDTTSGTTPDTAPPTETQESAEPESQTVRLWESWFHHGR